MNTHVIVRQGSMVSDVKQKRMNVLQNLVTMEPLALSA